MQTNRNSTRRSLLVSATALILSIAMLVGTTFAWFTDTASTGVNKIQAGNLDVALEMQQGENWVNAEGETLEFKKAAGAQTDEQVLWEPGCTYELPALRVVNKGNLALKYKVSISGIKGSAKLNEVIDWTINGADMNTDNTLSAGASDTLTIKGHMKENAGNEYQGLSIDGIAITVFATQYTAEYDSFNNTYDTDATYLNTDTEGNYLISNANELVYFAKSVNVDGVTYADKIVKLTADIDLAGKLWIPVGQTQVSSFQGTFDGQDHTIKNMTVNYTGTNSNYACGLFGWIELHNGAPIVIQNVKFDKANVTGIKYTGVVAGYANGASGAEIKNCVVNNSTVTSNSKNAGGIIGYMGKGVLTGNTVSGCTISAKYDVGGIANSVEPEPAVTFTKNKVENTKIYYEEDQLYDAAGIFTGGKVVYRDDNTKTTFLPDGTNTSSNVTVNKLVAVSTATELSSALNATYNADTIIKLANDIDLSGLEWDAKLLNINSNAKVTIDGNAKTITGLTTSRTGNINGFVSNGLIAAVHTDSTTTGSLIVKDLTVSNASVTNNDGASSAAGVFVGDAQSTHLSFENCKVDNARVTSSAYAAGLVGYCTQHNGVTEIQITNCTVTNSEFTGKDATGALVGLNNILTKIDGATVTNNTIDGGSGYSAAALVGTSIGGTTATNVTADENIFNISGNKHQVHDAIFGYVYTNNQSYSVDGADLN